MSEQPIKHWLMDVAGYGDWVFVGTEDEAEEVRAHKAGWEGAAGKKRALTVQYSDTAEKVLAEPWKERAERFRGQAEYAAEEMRKAEAQLERLKTKGDK